MAFKRSAVRSRLSPPLQKRLTEALSEESTSVSLLKKKLTMYLENWTLWLWCNYEKATVKEIFSQFQFQNWEGKNTIFAKEKLLETWACIIQLIENRLDYLLSWSESESFLGQANKSARGMPWHQEPMKDVISCDKLRGAANEQWSGDFRMGKPTARYPILNQIGIGGEPPELKHLSRARKRHQPRFRE